MERARLSKKSVCSKQSFWSKKIQVMNKISFMSLLYFLFSLEDFENFGERFEGVGVVATQFGVEPRVVPSRKLRQFW
jgi:hypothetical protein